MVGRVIQAKDLKARCSKILDEIALSGEPVTVIMNGIPIVELHPISKQDGRFFES